MENFVRIVEIVLPVLLALALGFLSRVKRILSREQIAGLKKFIVTFSLPAVLLNAFYSIDYSVSVLFIVLIIFAACTAAFFIGKLIVSRVKSLDHALPFLVTGFEAGMMGYALYTLLFGADKLSTMAMVALGGDVFVFTLYMVLLKRENGEDPGSVVGETLKSPIFIAIAAGVLLGATGLYKAISGTLIGAALDACAGFIAAPTACAILFVVGYGIEISGKDIKLAGRAALIRIAVMGVLCAAVIFIIRAAFGMDAYLMWALLLLFSLPGPYVLPVFLKDPNTERYASTCLSFYTLISIALFCLITVLAL